MSMPLPQIHHVFACHSHQAAANNSIRGMVAEKLKVDEMLIVGFHQLFRM